MDDLNRELFSIPSHPISYINNGDDTVSVLSRNEDETFLPAATSAGFNDQNEYLSDDRMMISPSKMNESIIIPTEEPREETQQPWWMTFIQEEGLLLGKVESETETQSIVPNDAAFLGDEKNEDDEEIRQGQIDAPPAAAGDDDDASVTDEDQQEDWKERLWIVARNHWSMQLEEDFQDSQPEEAELQILTAPPVDGTDPILQFRNLLLECLNAYVQVFGDLVVTSNNNNNSSSTSNPQKKKKTEKEGLTKEAASLSPYVPLKVVRCLFQQVLLDHQMRNSGENSNVFNRSHTSDHDHYSQEFKDPKFFLFAEHVTELLLSTTLDMFRTYTVESLSNEEGPTKRIRTDLISKERQSASDTEQLLYGDMYNTEEKEDTKEETKEEVEEEQEVRLRTGITTFIREWVQELELTQQDWRLPFLKEVLLDGLLKDSLSSDRMVALGNIDRRSETSLAYMYSIRYFPHFYLRAAWNPKPDECWEETTFGFLMQYFSDPRLIRNRLVVLGVYNGVMVHLEELNTLFDELHLRTKGSSTIYEDMYRDVHRAIKECLESIFDENMKQADFILDGLEWKASDTIVNPQFSIESDHPQVVSVCLEVGRSFHFQGVTMGRREQERLETIKPEEQPRLLDSTIQTVNFDNDMTDLEVSAYLHARSAYRGALAVLRRAEPAIRTSFRSSLPNQSSASNDQLLGAAAVELDRRHALAMKHIHEARVTIELYLSDTLTTLAYCYDVKLSDHKHALVTYNESLVLYGRHIGKDHPTVIHTLHSVGCIHMELKQWNEANVCFAECLALLKRSTGFDEMKMNEMGTSPIPPLNHSIRPESNAEIATVLKCLGITQMELGECDEGFDSLSKSMDCMMLSLRASGKFPTQNDPDNPNAVNEPIENPFVADAMSRMVDALMLKLSQINSTYARRRLAMLYTGIDQFDLQSIDGPRLTSLQIDRRAIEITREVVALREKILKLPNPSSPNDFTFSIENSSSNLPPWQKLLDYVGDLSKLGKLYFRRCDYSDAIKCWRDAYTFLIQNDDPDSLVYAGLQYPSRALQEAANKQCLTRINIVSELCFLTGVASSRIGENEKAVIYFEHVMNFLEQKRKILDGHDHMRASEDESDVLEMDLGYCEHAIGLAHFYTNKFTPATSHYREALRLFETVAARRKSRQLGEKIRGGLNDDIDSLDDASEPREKRRQLQIEERRSALDVAINGAIASVMLSLGGLYHEQQKADRARRFLEGAIQVLHSVTNETLSGEQERFRGISSITGFSEISLVVSIVRVGDAHRRIALMNLEKHHEEEAKLAFETAMKYLETTNLESRVTLTIDDEKHLESISQLEINVMLMNCYEHMMGILDNSKEQHEYSNSQSSGWFGFGGKSKENLDVLVGTGVTREDLLFRLGNIHAKRKKYDTAIRCFEESKQLTEERLGTSEHNIIGNILFNLGNIYKDIYAAQGEMKKQEAKEKAIEAYDESLRIAKVTSGPNAMAVAEVMESLAALLMEDDDPKNFPDRAYNEEEEATKLLREAISIRTKNRSEMNLSFGRSMHYLGLLCLRQQTRDEIKNVSRRISGSRLDEAISCFSQALRVRKVLLGDHWEVASTSHHLGVALCRKASSLPGKKSALMADALKSLNDSLFVLTLFLERTDRDWNEAIENERDITQPESDVTPDIKSIVICSIENLYDIALLHEAQGNYEIERARLLDALSLMNTWTESSKKTNWRQGRNATVRIALDETNVWRAKIYHNLGISWFEVGDYVKAISDFEESLRYRGVDVIETATSDEIFDSFFRQKTTGISKGRVLSPLPNAITMEKLALSYDILGQHDEALRCYAFALRVYGEHYSDESMKVCDVLKRMGKVYQDRHDYKRCVRALQRALHIRDMFDDEDSTPQIDDALVFVELARALMALGAYDQVALDHFYSAVGILEHVNLHLAKNGTQKSAIVPRVIEGGLKSNGDEHGTNELLLECHSSILILIRRQRTDIPDDEDRICEVIHRIGNSQAALGQYEKSLKSLTHVLQFQRSAQGNDRLIVADLLFNLGNIYVEVNQKELARECHQECHEITSEILGKDSIELAENMICLGNIEFLSNNFLLALDWFDDALRLLRNSKEFEVVAGKVLQRQAVAHDKLGNYDQAIECFGEVLKLGRRIWGVNNIEMSNVLNSLGNVHRNRGELRRALRCYEESLRIRLLSGDQLSVANTKNNIGAIFTSMGQINRARQLYADALRIKTDKLGSKHIETARTLFNLGQLYMADKQYKKALDFFDGSLQIFNLEIGENQNEAASCLCSIGTVYDEMHDEDLALSYFKKALHTIKGQGGSLSVKALALHNVGIILTKRNDFDHAVRIFREALEMKRSQADSEDMSDTQYCLANVLRMTGCISEALELHRAALETRVRYLGTEHIDVANSLFGLAQTLVDSNCHSDALDILEECRRIRVGALGEKGDEVADTAFLLGIVLREAGNIGDALKCLKEAHNVKMSTRGKDSMEVADISFKIAIVMCELGNYDEAMNYNKMSLQVRIEVLGDNHPEVGSSMENMGIIYQKLGYPQMALDHFQHALEIKRVSMGDQHEDVSNIVHAMAVSYTELDKCDVALRMFEDALRRKKITHSDIKRTLVDQGQAFERINAIERALMCYEEAIDTDSFEDNSWEIGRVFMQMGICHFKLRKSEDAWDCLTEAARVFELVERKLKRIKSPQITMRSDRDLRDLIRCYECMLRLSEINSTRYNIDKSLVLPKVAQVLVEIKQYKQAAVFYRDAIGIQKSLPGDTRFVVAINLHNLGNCLHQLGDFNEARICLEDALGSLQEIQGIEGKHVADTYHSLGFVLQSKSDLQESLSCYSNALKSRGRNVDSKFHVVSTLSNIGEVLRLLGMYDSSIKSCKDALGLIDSKDTSNFPVVSQIVECIGMTHRDRFEYEKALRCFHECLKQRRDAGETKNELSIARTLHQIGLILQLRGEKEKCEEIFKESLEIIERKVHLPRLVDADAKTRLNTLKEVLKEFIEEQHEKNPIEAAESLSTLGSLLDLTDRTDEGILCNEITIKFMEEALGSDHLMLATVKHRMGGVRFRLGEFDRSISRLREALLVRRAKLGDTHILTEETLKALASAYVATGNNEMALFYFKEALSMRKDRSIGQTDKDSEADLQLRLGKLHLEQYEYAEALACLKNSLKLQRQSRLSMNERKLGDILQCMGSSLLELKQFQEARVSLLSALKILERSRGDGSEMLNTTYLLGRVNEDEKSYDKAIIWFDKSLGILNRMDVKDQKMNARITFRIGMVKFGVKEYDDALSFVEEAKIILAMEFGTSHYEYGRCLHSLGRIHFAMSKFSQSKESFQAALQILQQHTKPNDVELGDLLYRLGACLYELQQYQEAYSCLGESLQIGLVHADEDSYELGDIQRYLGHVEYNLGKLRPAMEHFQNAIRIGLQAPEHRSDRTDCEVLLPCFAACIEMAKSNQNQERLAKLYHQQGSVLSRLQMFKKAMNSFFESIQCYKMLHGENHLSVANALFNVGVCLKETGDTDRAMKCFGRALAITKSQLGDDHAEVADTLQQMAEVYRMKGDVRGALKWCEQSLQIRRYTEDVQLAALLNFTGELCIQCHDSDEAERSFRECVRIRRKVYGDDHMDVAQSLFSLGRVYETSRKDHTLALRCYEESLRIHKTTQDDDDLDTARIYLHLGNVHSYLHNDAKAAFCFTQATAICSQHGDPDNEVVEDAVVGQGHAMVAQGKFEEGLLQYERARGMRINRSTDERQESKELADLSLYEAEAFEKLGKYQEALHCLDTALEMYSTTVGIEHLSTSNALQRLAELHLDMDHRDEALSVAQQALQIRKSLLGMNNEATGESYFIIGKIFFVRNEFETALPCLDSAFEIFRKRRGINDLRVANTMYYIGCIKQAWRHWREAIENFQGALPARQKCLGRDHLLVADVLYKLGTLHIRCDEWDLGSDCFSECLRIRRLVRGPDHIEVADTLFQLAGCLKYADSNKGKLDPAQCYADAIRVYREIYGENDVSVGKCLAKLGAILDAKKEPKKAGGCYERAVNIFAFQLRDDLTREEIHNLALEDEYESYAGALFDYGTFLDGTGSDGSAMKTYRQALKFYQILRGRDHEIIGITHCRIATILGRQKRFTEAMQLYGEVLKRRLSDLGDTHPLVADVYYGICVLLDHKRDYPAAIASIEKCLRIRRATLGAWSEPVAEALTMMGIILKNRADFKGALESWDEALAVYKKAGVPDDCEKVISVLKLEGIARTMMESVGA